MNRPRRSFLMVALAGQFAVVRLAPEMPEDALIVMNLCGRGDKDIFTVANRLGVAL